MKKKNPWKEMLELSKKITAVYNREREQLMIRQHPDLISVIPKNLEKKVFKWVLNKEIKEGSEKLLKWLLKEGNEKLLKWLLNREYYRERREVRRR